MRLRWFCTNSHKKNILKQVFFLYFCGTWSEPHMERWNRCGDRTTFVFFLLINRLFVPKYITFPPHLNHIFWASLYLVSWLFDNNSLSLDSIHPLIWKVKNWIEQESWGGYFVVWKNDIQWKAYFPFFFLNDEKLLTPPIWNLSNR